MNVPESEFLAFAANLFGQPVESLSLETAYGSIPAWDSVMQLRLTLEISALWQVDIPLDEIAGLRTLGQFYGYVKGDA
ncbi:MAG: acyl carrier protein [Kiritimatiellia bacterium]